MTYKCPNCYGALKYNAALDKMECEYCGSIFTMDEINQLYAHMEEKTSQYTDGQIKAQSQVNRENQNPDLNAANKNQDTIEKEKLNVNIYRCSSCGAELAVNGVESSSVLIVDSRRLFFPGLREWISLMLLFLSP